MTTRQVTRTATNPGWWRLDLPGGHKIARQVEIDPTTKEVTDITIINPPDDILMAWRDVMDILREDMSSDAPSIM